MIKRVFPILALSISSSTLGFGIVVPLLPLYAESLGASGVWLGVIFAGFSISNAISTPVFGRLSDRAGRRLFIVIGLLLYSIVSLGFVWASTVYQLVLVRLLQGMVGGMVLPIAQSSIGDIAPEGEEGRWMGYANAAFFIGFGLGPLLGGTLAEGFGMNAAFFTMGGLNLFAFLVAVFFLPEVGERKSKSASPLSFKQMGASGVMKGIFTFRLTYTLGIGAFMAFLPVFADFRFGLNTGQIGILLAVYQLLLSLLGIPSGRIADRFSRRAMVVIGGLASSVSLALIPLTGGFSQLLVLIILGSCGSALSLPSSLALTVEEGRKFGMGSAIAVFTMAFSLGMGIGPIISGAISDFAGINSVFYFGAAAMLVGAGLFAWFTR